MILAAIAAMSRNRVIGVNNKLPWHLPEDLKYFKEKTAGKILIMGRKTYESIGSKPLPKRFHFVVSRNSEYKSNHEMVKVVPSIEAAIEQAKKLIPQYPEEVMICGGGEIYKQSLPFLNRLYLTVIEQDFNGDAYFPEFEQIGFKLKSKDEYKEPMAHSYRIYEK